MKATEAILCVFPLDTYSDPAFLMDMTDSNKAKGMRKPVIWAKYHDVCVVELKLFKRFEFYERAKKACAVIQTGEERQYGNLILVKGVVL